MTNAEQVDVLDETNPEGWRINGNTVRIACQSTSKDIPGTDIIGNGIYISGRDLVTEICIDGTSRLMTLEIVRLFPGVKRVVVESDRILDFSALKDLKSLQELHVASRRSSARLPDVLSSLNLATLAITVNTKSDMNKIINISNPVRRMYISGYKDYDFVDTMGKIRFQFLMMRCKIVRIGSALPVRVAGFYYCPTLVDIGGVHAEEVEIDTCRSVDWGSCGKNPILSRLIVRNCGTVDIGSIVARAESLRVMVITSSKIDASSAVRLILESNLSVVYIAGMKADAIRKIANARADICVTNGRDVWCRGQSVISKEAYYHEYHKYDVGEENVSG